MRRHLITALLLVAPAAALAAQDTTRAQDPQSKTNREARPQDDRGLVLKMHRGHQTEIRAGQLAQQNGSSEQVKRFGAQLVRDHQNADRELTRVAGQLGISLPRQMDSAAGHPDHQDAQRPDYQDPSQGRMDRAQTADTTHGAKMIQRLSRLQGAEFDREFAKAMVQSHQQTLRTLEQAQEQTQREELRTLVQNTIPTVRRHLQIAESLTRSVATTSSGQN